MPARSNAAAPTLESVAHLAGVSRATAGRVLSGSTTVGEAARAAVLAAAAQLHYVPNLAARSLVTRRSGSIGFVVGESEERFFEDPYFAQVLRGVHLAMADHDRQLVFTVISGEVGRRRFERFALGGHLDGAILVSLHGADPLPLRLREAGVAVVLAGRPLREDAGVLPWVNADNVGGAESAARLLAGAGRRRIATITGPQDMAVTLDRLAGFRRGLAAFHADGARPAGVADGDFSITGGRSAMAELLVEAPDLDAVFAANDLMALGAMAALAQAGRRVPDDVAVVGFDDSPLAASAQPALTTVRQPMVQMGRTLAQLLIAQIETDCVPAPVVLPTEIVRRHSA